MQSVPVGCLDVLVEYLSGKASSKWLAPIADN